MKTINEIYEEAHKKEKTSSNSIDTSLETTAIARSVVKLIEEKIAEKIANDENCILFEYPVTIDQFNLSKDDVKQIAKTVIDEMCTAGYEDKGSFGLWDDGTCTINIRLLLYPLTDQDKKKMKKMDRIIGIFDGILYMILMLTFVFAIVMIPTLFGSSNHLLIVEKGFIFSFIFLLFWGGFDVVISEWLKSKCKKIAKKYVRNN